MLRTFFHERNMLSLILINNRNGITLIVVTATFVLASFQDSVVQGSEENAAASVSI